MKNQYDVMREVYINLGLNDCRVQSLFSANSWAIVETERKNDLFFTDASSKSIFWTQQWSQWKTNPKSELNYVFGG